MEARPGLLRRLWWALILRCPGCRHAPIFAHGYDMFDRCPNCDLLLNREPGYFVGGMEINVAVTCLVSFGIYFAASGPGALPHIWSVALACGAAVVFPLAFLRHARSLWICLDRSFDPHDHWWEPRDQ
jgi:uncharacterized protein (DUF983 family)